MRLRAGRDNVCVLRTFSKAYGLATLRVGYAVVPEAIAQRARMTGMVFYPGGLAQLAAVAALEPEAEKQVLERCAEFAGVRAQFTEDLRAAGLQVPDSQANFVWLPLGADAEDFAARCQAAGVLVRAHPGPGGAGHRRHRRGEPAAAGRGGRRMRVLVTSWGWRSHFYPLVPLAWALRSAGHEVLVASQPSMTEDIVGAGLPAVGGRRGPGLRRGVQRPDRAGGDPGRAGSRRSREPESRERRR